MSTNTRSNIISSLLSRLGLGYSAQSPLLLHVPVPSRQAKPLETDAHQLQARFATLKLGPAALLKEVNRYLEHLNQWEVEPERRLVLTDIAMAEAVSAVRMLFMRFVEQGNTLPESAEQRDGLSQGIRVADRLATAYKHIFKHDYLAARGLAQNTGARLQICSIRILELTRLEQLHRAFRYQKLPEHVWKDCNEVFFAMRKLKAVEFEHELKVRLSVKSGESERELFPETANLMQLYLSIQVTGLVDPLSWPVHLMYILDKYINTLPKPLMIVDDHGGDLDVGQVVATRGNGSPPRFDRAPKPQTESVLIETGPLILKVSDDREQLISSSASGSLSSALENLSELERLPFIDLLYRKLSPQRRREQRQYAYNTKYAKVNFNFSSIHHLLQRIDSGDTLSDAGEQTLAESLSNFPVTIDDDDKTTKNMWVVVDESIGGIQLRIREDFFIPSLIVGQLVSFSIIGEDDHSTKIGYVVRLHRVADLEVEVAIACLPGACESVTLRSLSKESALPHPAILLRDKQHLYILCDNKLVVNIGDKVSLYSKAETISGAVSSAKITKADFTLHHFLAV